MFGKRRLLYYKVIDLKAKENRKSPSDIGLKCPENRNDNNV